MNPFHPELRGAARILRFAPMYAPALRWLDRMGSRLPGFTLPSPADLTVRNVNIPASDGARLRVRTYQPTSRPAASPALLWIHGGGLVIGAPEQDEANNIECARELGLTIAAVRYRRAPEHPFPTPLEDCYSALSWLHHHADELGVDRTRIAVAGASAGGGLAAALAQLAHDRAQLSVAFQLLIYPMLDDRSAVRLDVDHSRLRLWSQASNRYGWSAYLGRPAGSPETPAYAVPARRAAYGGLPPAWIGVGTCDLFHDEALAYAAQLKAAGVACELLVVPGAYHAFDRTHARSHVVRAFRASYVEALRRALR